MNNQDRFILVSGATGQQGGATTRHLIANGWKVRALTRDPNKPESRSLADLGAEVVYGDMEDPDSLGPALNGAYGAFSVQNFWVTGYDAEVRQGKNLADAAREAGVEHFVYTSVGSAHRNTGISHFDSKREIEVYIRDLGLPATILRPVFFMDNFSTYNPPTRENGGLTLSLGIPPDTPLQMIAVDDVGAFAALAFSIPEEFKGRELDLAGDELTMTRVVEIWSEVSGETVRYAELPIEQVRSFSEDSAVMYEWFVEEGYEADIPVLRRLQPELKTFRQWLQTVPVTS